MKLTGFKALLYLNRFFFPNIVCSKGNFEEGQCAGTDLTFQQVATQLFDVGVGVVVRHQPALQLLASQCHTRLRRRAAGGGLKRLLQQVAGALRLEF